MKWIKLLVLIIVGLAAVYGSYTLYMDQRVDIDEKFLKKTLTENDYEKLTSDNEDEIIATIERLTYESSDLSGTEVVKVTEELFHKLEAAENPKVACVIYSNRVLGLGKKLRTKVDQSNSLDKGESLTSLEIDFWKNYGNIMNETKRSLEEGVDYCAKAKSLFNHAQTGGPFFTAMRVFYPFFNNSLVDDATLERKVIELYLFALEKQIKWLEEQEPDIHAYDRVLSHAMEERERLNTRLDELPSPDGNDRTFLDRILGWW